MGRLFSVLSVVVILIIVAAGAGVHWLGSAQIARAKQDSGVAISKSVALGIAAQINLLADMLDKMAQDPEVQAAAAGADPAQMAATAAKLERHLPGALKVRLLPPGVNELDDKSVPKMGYADLDMVRETFTKNQLPAIQGDNGPDRHLAMAHQVVSGGRVVGVILASLKYDFIGKTVQAAELKNGRIELKQATLVLGAAGAPASSEPTDEAPIKVAGTGWELHYQPASVAETGDLALIASIIGILSLLALLGFFVAYRLLSGLLAQDLASLLKAGKDILSNKLQPSYPVKLAEINVVISNLAQFKRVLDSEDDDISSSDHVAPASASSAVFDDFDAHFFSDPFESASATSKFTQPDLVETSVPDAYDMPPSIKKTADIGPVFKAYDIRGIAGKTLTKELVYDIGRALGTLAKKQGVKTVVVGRDGRTSSPQFAEDLAKGIITTGLNVLDIGLVPTPLLYFVARHTEGRTGVMLTGSHNPANYNGLKMVVNGETLAGEQIQQLKTCIENQAYATDKPGKIEHNTEYGGEYIGVISEDVRVSRPMTVVLDCGNGAAGELGPKLLKALGCEVMELFCDIDGTFPNHHPDPSNPANLGELIATVKHYKADIGIAFDGDGDRLGVVDSNGKIIWPDRQLMLFAKDLLATKPGSEIIYDVKCSRHLTSQISKAGGRPTMWKTGHSLMKAKLKETGAKLAGEMSGHIFFNDRWFGFDDALYAAARLLEILSRDARSSAEVFSDFPDSLNTPELNVALAEGENFTLMEKLLTEAQFPGGKITDIDGLRVDFPNGWGLVRASNTTPSLVIRFEADSEAAMGAIQDQFRELMKKVKPDIALPF
ncbi:MAG: phosphomannomutase/phosphoglucomutase [Methylobacter sp.]